MITTDDVRSCILALTGPEGAKLLDATGDRLDVAVGVGGKVFVSIAVPAADAVLWEPVRALVERAVGGLPDVASVTVALTSQRVAAATQAGGVGMDPRAVAAKDVSAAKQPVMTSLVSSPGPKLAGLAGVAHVIAVASGKGGVGKSTTACNLALGLRALGLRVGVLDADIYGPSMPKLFALKGQPEIITGRTLRPLEAYGCKVMSIGFVVDASKAMVWRGPMVASAITQMLRDVAWGTLDVLVVDMPPGTGDAQLTMAQQTPLSGAVIVSTPQDLALIDARRGVSMFRDVNVPIIGIIENMSYFVCDGCGKRHDIFAHGGARAEAGVLGVPFLGEIPLDIEIRERSDAGLPIVVTAPDGPHAQTYRQIARTVWSGLQKRPAG